MDFLANVSCSVLVTKGDTKIASCAGDGLVKVHDLVHTATTTFDHHCASVNELEIEPGSPNLILSSSDDCTG